MVTGSILILFSIFKETTKSSMAKLKCWGIVEFGGRQKKLDELVNRLKELRFCGRQYSSRKEIKRVKRQIQNILTDEEIY